MEGTSAPKAFLSLILRRAGGTGRRAGISTVLEGQSEGQFEGLQFRAKCNGPNGLSSDLTHIQNLESYRWTISHPWLAKKTNRSVFPVIGTSQIFRLRTWSPTTQTPTVHAMAKRSIKYTSR